MFSTLCYCRHLIQLSVVRNSLVCLRYKPNVFIGVCIRKETGNKHSSAPVGCAFVEPTNYQLKILVLNTSVQAGEIAPLVKYLPCTDKVLSSIPPGGTHL